MSAAAWHRPRAGPEPPHARISRYEHGVHAVEPNTAERIAQVLDVPLAYFYANSEEMAELTQIFDHLNAEKQQQLLDYARGLQPQ